MLQLKNILIVFSILFLFDFAEAQNVPQDLINVNNESKVRIRLRRNSDEIQFVSIKYTPQTYVKRLYRDGRNDNYFTEIKNRLEKVFFEDKEYIDSDNPANQYEMDEVTAHDPPKAGDKEIETRKIYIFSLAKSVDPETITRDIISVFVVKKMVKFGSVVDESTGKNTIGRIMDTYNWYAIYGTNLKILLDNDQKLKKDLIAIANNRNVRDIDLRPVIVIPEYGISVISTPEELQKAKMKFTNNPPLDEPKTDSETEEVKSTIDPITWKCDNADVKLLGIPEPIEITEQGKEYSLKFKITNNSYNDIKIAEPKFTENSKNMWVLKTPDLAGKVIAADSRYEFEITYKSTKNSAGDKTNFSIPFSDVKDNKPYTGSINSISANMKEDKSKAGKLFLDLSLFNLSTTFWLPSVDYDAEGNPSISYKWNFSLNMGHKEIGYPFWTSANWNFMAGYGNIIKLGFSFPGGNILSNDIGPITVPKRKLHGVWGLVAELDMHTFTIENNSPFTFGGYFYYGNIREYTDPPKGISQDYYYVPMIMQFWYPIIFSEKTTRPKYIFQAKLGFSYHQVKQVHITQPNEVGQYFNEDHLVLKEDIGKIANWDKVAKISSPFIKVDYINLNAKNKYGFGFQYSNKVVSIESWIEFGNILRLEGNFSKTLQKPELWENSSIFWISPRFYLPLSF